MYKGATIAIATLHKKESIIAPFFIELGGEIIVPNIDTDQFGMFSGEQERVLTPYEVLKIKCEEAMKLAGVEIAVSSEGSFGAHPLIPFVQGNEELVMLLDKKNSIELIGRKVSTETNFSGRFVSQVSEGIDFYKGIGFPSHGIILKDKKNGFNLVVKDLDSEKQLLSTLENLLTSHEKVWMESDMRAMRNPTRMKVIREATIDLMNQLSSLCPSCGSPGFWKYQGIEGLPCSLCGLPTESIKEVEYKCQCCDFVETRLNDRGLFKEDPTYCNFCNP